MCCIAIDVHVLTWIPSVPGPRKQYGWGLMWCDGMEAVLGWGSMASCHRHGILPPRLALALMPESKQQTEKRIHNYSDKSKTSWAQQVYPTSPPLPCSSFWSPLQFTYAVACLFFPNRYDLGHVPLRLCEQMDICTDSK